MNAPERFELLVLPEGAKKLTVKKDTKIPNAATFLIEREDHTLGNALRSFVYPHHHYNLNFRQLLKDGDVVFSGYRVAHPLVHSVELKVQTKKTTTPQKCLSTALNALIMELGTMQNRFQSEISKNQKL